MLVISNSPLYSRPLTMFHSHVFTWKWKLKASDIRKWFQFKREKSTWSYTSMISTCSHFHYLICGYIEIHAKCTQHLFPKLLCLQFVKLFHWAVMATYIVWNWIATYTMNSTEVQNPRCKLDDKCLCLSYVFGSVLACAKSAHVFQKLSYFIWHKNNSLLFNNKLLFLCQIKKKLSQIMIW